MSQMNLFTWLRDGVRQSVLLGVSDAIEQIGTPANADELHPSVSNFLKLEGDAESGVNKRVTNSGAKTRAKKRLGKSLKEIGPGAENDS